MKMKTIIMLAGCLLAAHTITKASCSINPLDYTGRTVSVSLGYGGETGRTHFAGFRGYTILGVTQGYLDVWPGTGWSSSGFDVTKITDRVVSGDFNQDGLPNDIAAIYDDGSNNVSIRTWTISSAVTTYNGSVWSSSGYNANNITGRVVVGDFDNDGYYDDIAAFYDYGSGAAKIHVWLGSSSGFTYAWWLNFSSGYYCNMFTGRMVSGDFDRDGYCDDIATMYDYGSGAMRIHMFTGSGSSFSYGGTTGWWSVSSGYSPSNISFRVVSGNFDHSGVIDHKSDDIVAIYDYGSGAAKAHVWTSTGSSFSYAWKWEVTGFPASNITDRFVPFNLYTGDDADRSFGMGALYNYGTSTTVGYRWDASTGGSWNFSSYTTELCPLRLSYNAAQAPDPTMTPALSVNAFPNPGDGHVTLEIAPTSTEGLTSIVISDISGRVVLSKEVNTSAGYREEIDLSSFGKGIYLLHVVSPDHVTETKKLVVE